MKKLFYLRHPLSNILGTSRNSLTFIFASILVLEIFSEEAFGFKFKIQFLSKWYTSGSDISRTTANIAIKFSAIHIQIKTIILKKISLFHGFPCKLFTVVFLQLFLQLFLLFSTLTFLRYWYPLLLSYTCRLICVVCLFVCLFVLFQ